MRPAVVLIHKYILDNSVMSLGGGGQGRHKPSYRGRVGEYSMKATQKNLITYFY